MTLRFAPAPTGLIHVGNFRTWIICSHLGDHCNIRVDDTNAFANYEFIKNIKKLSLIFNLPIKNIHCQSSLHAKKRYIEFLNKIKNLTFEEDNCIRLKVNQPIHLVINKKSITVNITYNPVLLKSNGTPTFFLSVLSDDYDYKINHIVRGMDHIETCAIQHYVYEKIGFSAKFTILSFVLDSEGNKISKSKGALPVLDELYSLGICPTTLVIYLMKPSASKKEILLHLDKKDIMDRNSGYIIWDKEKVISLNRFVIDAIGFEQFYKNFIEWCEYLDMQLKYFYIEVIQEIYKAFKLRYKTFIQFYEFYQFVMNNKEYIILHPKIIDYNNKYQQRIATEYEKRYLQLAMQLACSDYNTPTANEIINIYACKKKKSDTKI